MENKKQSLLSWRISKEELDKQVNQYFQLKSHQSFRGISTLILSFGLLVSTIISVFLSIPSIDILFGVAIGAILIYFVYNGHRWAMVASILYFTANVLMSSFNRIINGTFSTTSLILIGIVWLVVTGYLIKAIRIENYRTKEKYNKTPKKIETKEKNNQFIALIRSNSKTPKPIFVLITLMLIIVSGYLYYAGTQEDKMFCLNRIDYRANHYYLKDGDWKITRFKTKTEAMEYCLTFRETENKELSFSDYIIPTDVENQGFTLEEMREMQNR